MAIQALNTKKPAFILTGLPKRVQDKSRILASMSGSFTCPANDPVILKFMRHAELDTRHTIFFQATVKIARFPVTVIRIGQKTVQGSPF